MDDILLHNLHKNAKNMRNTLMLDVSRRHMSATDIKDCINSINTDNFEQVQLHLNDNEGFALTISKNTQGWLSFSDLNQIIQYANQKGLVVTLDIDIPGHSQALINILKNLDSSVTWNMDEHTLDYTKDYVKQAIYSIYGIILSNITETVNWNLGVDEVTGNLVNASDLAEIINNLYRLLARPGSTIYIWNDCLNHVLLPSINGNIHVIYWHDSDVNTLDQLKESVNPIINANETTNYYNCVDISNTSYITSRLTTKLDPSCQLVALWGENSTSTVTNTQLATFISKL